jgi:hypothetical protein
VERQGAFLLCLRFRAAARGIAAKDVMEPAVAVSDGNSAAAAPSSPTTFAEAFASDASSASTTPDQSTTPAAAVTPPTSEGSPQQPDREPFIPRARFDEVNTSLNALKQWKEQYAWAEQVPREQLTAAMEFYRQFNGDDPIAALQTLAQKLQAHEVHGPKLRSMAARTLAAARGQSQASGPDLSAIAIDLGNGQQVTLGDLKNQWIAEVEQKFAPVTKTVEQITADRKQAERDEQIRAFTTSTFDDVKTWPGMDNPENGKKLGEALAAMQVDGNDPREVALALNKAYRQVVLPTLSAKAESKLLDTLQHKAAATTSVNPGSAAHSAPKPVKSFHDLPADAWR